MLSAMAAEVIFPSPFLPSRLAAAKFPTPYVCLSCLSVYMRYYSTTIYLSNIMPWGWEIFGSWQKYVFFRPSVWLRALFIAIKNLQGPLPLANNNNNNDDIWGKAPRQKFRSIDELFPCNFRPSWWYSSIDYGACFNWLKSALFTKANQFTSYFIPRTMLTKSQFQTQIMKCLVGKNRSLAESDLVHLCIPNLKWLF